MKIATIAAALALAIAGTAAHASPIQVKINQNAIMCASEDNVHEVVKLAQDGDDQALAEFITDPTNLCGSPKPGEVFYFEQLDADTGMVEVRAKGVPISVWTIKEAVDPIN